MSFHLSYRHLAVTGLLVWISVVLLGTSVVSAAPEYQPGQSYFGRNNYIEYRAGNLPVILTAGHGGHLQPEEIPDRTWGTTATDANTRQLTEAIAAELFQRTGKHPHVIISHLRRTKLDPNREIGEAAQENEFAEQAWHEYHGFIETARVLAEAEYGFGFLADIHGHGHEIQRLELGYGLGNAQLNLSNAELEAPGFGWNSSLRTLMLRRPEVSFPELLRGSRSLGHLFNDRGVPAWPSPEYPSPGDAPFFSGGYTTRQHTCFVDNGPINGVQIEANFTGIRDSASNRSAFAANFARVMQPYLWDNYGYSIGTLSLYTLQTEATALEKGGAPVTLQILREGHIGFASSVTLELGGTATYGDDYLISNGIVHFSNGQSASTVTLFPRPPNGELGDKAIEVRLAPNLRQAADLTPIVLPLGDGISQTVRIGAETETVAEGDGEARFRLRRTASTDPLTVNLTWSGTAVPGLDYDFPWDLPQSVTFPAGATEIPVSITLVDDAIPEPNKTIQLSLVPGPNYQIGHPGEATIRLIDDDQPSGLGVWLRGELTRNLLLDSSGHHRHATTLPAGRGPTTVATPEGPAIVFDGVESTAALPKFALDSAEGFTIAFYFRIDSGTSTSQHNLISFGPRGAPGSLNIYLSNASTLRTWMGTASASGLDVSRPWTDGAWRHFALTVDAGGVKRVFIDGQVVRAASGWIPPLDENEILWLGWRRATGTASDFLGGSLRDFRVYNRSLATSEVTSLATGHLTFDAWRRKHDVSAGASPLADLDGDGLPLAVEYALGSDPTSPAPPPRYQARMADNRLVLDFIRQTRALDLHWRIEATSDPAQSWETIAELPPNSTTWILEPGVDLHDENGWVSVKDGQTIQDASGRFMRLQLEIHN